MNSNKTLNTKNNEVKNATSSIASVKTSIKISELWIDDHIARQWPQWLSSLAAFVLTKRGWRVEGAFINQKKAILSVAPHTTNWDFFIGLLVVFSLRLKLNFFGKHTIFVQPLGYIIKKLGGIPVKRSKAHGVVTSIVEKIKHADELVLALAPEGTRSPIFPWKTGFLHIAKEADIPIQLISLDYRTKIICFGHVIQTVENIDEQMQTIYTFYDNVCPKYPEKCITRPQ
ncbi:1-acyl-sn-glycerol-3-phosphate acyltransferase [Alteromonas sp. A081]|uniref:1-acyl-sn-glycerol-3-phosphate acyltransferase n=1 Tax=Alteromonas sp. A081 TaxID=3410269 RepID=UPI003B987FE9